MNALRLGRFLGLASLGLAMVSPLPLAADLATGSFHFGKVQFQPVDALAYQQDGKDPKKPVTIVVLADFQIDRPAVMEAIDTAGALLQQVTKQESGNFVMVSMTSPDRCGVSAYLGESAQQIGLSDDFPAKTKTSNASRITGECSTRKPGKMFDDAYEFRLSYDLPLTPIPKPSPVPAGGGEPGLALVALINAIRTADWNAAHLHLREEEVPRTAPKAAEMKDYFHGLALNYPKTATVTGGLIKGDRAQIEIQGTDLDGKKIKGTFAMKKVAGNWRVLDQSLYFSE